MQNTKIQPGTFLRNSANFTFQVLATNDPNQLALKPIDHEGNTKFFNRSVLEALYKNHNYVIVTNPNNWHEKFITKAYAQRLLIK